MGDIYRTPNSSNSNNEYNVNPTGANNNNNANNSNGLSPDYMNSQYLVTEQSVNAEQPCREMSSSPMYRRKSDGLCAVPFDYADLIEAVRQCKSGVNWKDSVAGFVKNRFYNCDLLMTQLQRGTYKLSRYSCFTIREPKVRRIVATNIRDRVVQRALCNAYLYDALTKDFIPENFACLVGRGTTKARKHLKKIMSEAYEEYLDSAYICKIDIKDYFGSTDHEVAKDAVAKRVDNGWAREYVFNLIDSFDDVIEKGKGIGLGSQISQLIELTVLDDIDHYIKETLGIRYYVRYMDDFILICDSKKTAQKCLVSVEDELAKLKLKVSIKKTYIAPLRQGIKFLGFRYDVHDDGFVSMRVLPEKISRERRRLRKQLTRFPVEQCDDSFRSWKANARQGTSYKLVQKMNAYYHYNRRKKCRLQEEQKKTSPSTT